MRKYNGPRRKPEMANMIMEHNSLSCAFGLPSSYFWQDGSADA